MHKWITLFLLLAFALNYGCSAPQYIWPQKDMEFYEINQQTFEKKILIASRKSEFKNALVEEIHDAFVERPVYIKIIGIEDLKDEDPNQYSAVFIINTCMAWEIDRKVETFLDKYGELDSIIVLTTSSRGDILPDTERRQFDAVSCASSKEQIAPIADEIIKKLFKIVEEPLSET